MVGGSRKSKGLEMRKEIKEGEKKKRENFGKVLFLTVPNHKNSLSKRILTLITLIHSFRGKNIIDFEMRRDRSRGRKSKAGGG